MINHWEGMTTAARRAVLAALQVHSGVVPPPCHPSTSLAMLEYLAHYAVKTNKGGTVIPYLPPPLVPLASTVSPETLHPQDFHLPSFGPGAIVTSDFVSTLEALWEAVNGLAGRPRRHIQTRGSSDNHLGAETEERYWLSQVAAALPAVGALPTLLGELALQALNHLVERINVLVHEDALILAQMPHPVRTVAPLGNQINQLSPHRTGGRTIDSWILWVDLL